MKNFLIMVFVLIQLFTVSIYAQRKPQKQIAMRKVQYDKLADYVNSGKSRPGERLIVSDAPLIKKVKSAEDEYGNRKGFYQFEYSEKDEEQSSGYGAGASFYTSAVLAKSLRPHLKSDAITLHITCTIIEFDGGQDFYRMPFATKVEGLENGAVIWIATGTEPPRFEFREGDKLRD